ncbi:hypothetical protein pb186bvf_016417 [Paramecium bursaria]
MQKFLNCKLIFFKSHINQYENPKIDLILQASFNAHKICNQIHLMSDLIISKPEIRPFELKYIFKKLQTVIQTQAFQQSLIFENRIQNQCADIYLWIVLQLYGQFVVSSMCFQKIQRIILKISKDDRCRKIIENRAMIERSYQENGKWKNQIKIIQQK